jgi:CBS domain-containing protein
MLGVFRKGHGLFLGKHVHPLIPLGNALSSSTQAVPGNESVRTALRICMDGHRNILVTDSRGERFRGIVTSRNLLDFMGAGTLHRIYCSKKDGLKSAVSEIMETGHREMERIDTLSRALSVFKESGEEVIPIVSGSRLEGAVTEADIVGQVSRPTGVRVREIMTGRPVVARINHPVSEVAGMLVRGSYSRLPVVRDSFLTGVVTPTDILKYLSDRDCLGGLRKERSEIEKAMNRFVESVGPDQDVFEAASIMKRKGISMLPVVESYHLVGVISQRDIIEAM